MKKNIKGLTIKQIKNAIFGKNVKNNLRDHQTKIIQEKQKPERVFRKIQKYDFGVLLNTTYSTSKIVSQLPTPDWFTCTEKVDVSVVVPLYKNCISNIVETWDFFNDNLKVEIIFIDDNCPNNSGNNVLSSWQKRFDEIIKPIGKILRSSHTQGWGACCNAGAEAASGKFVVFLTPEVKLFPRWLSGLLKFLRNNDVACVGGLFVNELNDEVIEAGREWDSNNEKFLEIGSVTYRGKKINSPFKMNNVPFDIFKSGERQCISSNLFAIKREDFLNWGGFSRNIFNQNWSDADFCLTVLEKNKKIIYQPASRIYGEKKQEKIGVKSKNDEALFYNKWILSNRLNAILNTDSQKNNATSILIKRQAAHGDVLVAAAVAPALKKKYPDSEIIFATDCPEVLQGNPWINKVVTECSERQFNLFINLDMAYEYRPKINFLKSFAENAGVEEKDCKLFLKTDPLEIELPEKYVVIHSSNSLWAGRNWTSIKFDQISNRLQREGIKIVCVGTQNDHKPLCCDVDLRDQTSVQQLATIIKNCSFFIGTDSFPMHVAQTFDIPGIVFFGSILPETRLISKNMIPVFAEGLKCLGCHHRKTVPCVATTTCEMGVQECITGVSVDRMWKYIQAFLQNQN